MQYPKQDGFQHLTQESAAPEAVRSPSTLNYLHSVVAIPLIYLYTVVMGSLSLTLSLGDANGRKQHWCAQIWCRMIARTVGVRVRVHGLENITPGVSYVFLSS